MWIYTVKQNKTKEKQADEISTIINVKREFRRRLNAFTKELWYDQHITSQIFVYMSEWTKKALPIELVILLFTIEIESSFVASLFSSPDDTTSHAYICSVCVSESNTHTWSIDVMRGQRDAFAAGSWHIANCKCETNLFSLFSFICCLAPFTCCQWTWNSSLLALLKWNDPVDCQRVNAPYYCLPHSRALQMLRMHIARTQFNIHIWNHSRLLRGGCRLSYTRLMSWIANELLS